MENINITPNASKLINSMRYLTYTNKTAIADIVDNSFDAGADNVDISLNDKFITITDDGCGMTPEVMSEAIKFGSDTDKDQNCLGKFGMGLSTASVSMARKLEVTSRDLYADKASKAVLSIDYINKTNDWKGLVDAVDEADEKLLAEKGHGTIVRLSQLDKVEPGLEATLKKHLRLVFRNFLAAGKTITINGEGLTPIDPLSRDLDDTEIMLEDDVEIDGEKVHIVVAHIATDKSDSASKYSDANHLKIGQSTQGFYVVRNNREIAEAQLLGIVSRHPSYNRFRCEVSFPSTLDNQFGINFTKNRVDVTQAVQDKITALVGPLMTLIASQAKRAKEVKDAEKISHNDAETVIDKRKTLLNTKKKWLEKRKKPTPKPGEENETETEAEDEDDKKKQKRVRKNIKHIQPGNRAMGADISEADLGEFGPMFECYFEGNKIVIHWNIRHPFHSKVIAKYSGDKNVITPIDLMIYSLAQEYLTISDDEEAQKMALCQAFEGMSSNLRVLLH